MTVYTELQKKRKQKIDAREKWWIKVPWMFGLRSEGTIGEYSKKKEIRHFYDRTGYYWKSQRTTFICLKPAEDAENQNIPHAYFEEEWQYEFEDVKKRPRFLMKGYDIEHAVDPGLLAIKREQRLDETAFLLLPIYNIVRQGAEIKGEKGEEDKIQFEVPAGITAFFEEHARRVKIWLKHGVNYKAILMRYGGFVGVRDRSNYSAFFSSADDKANVVIKSLPFQELLFDKPGVVEGRTHYFNKNYENYREHADEVIKSFLPLDPAELFQGFEGIEENPCFKNVNNNETEEARA